MLVDLVEHLRPHSHVVEPGLWIFLPQLGKQVVPVSEEESPVGTIPWPQAAERDPQFSVRTPDVTQG